MLRERLFNSKNWIPIIIVIAFLFAGVYNLIASSQTNLPAFVEDGDEMPFEREEVAYAPPTTFQFSEYGYNIEIPEGWTRVTRQGHTSFINNQDGTSLQIQLLDYTPSFNMVDVSTISNDVAAAGGVLEDFSRMASDAYAVVYSYPDTIYMEFCTWDMDAAIRLQFTTGREAYDDYYPTMIYVLDSFAWEKQHPIPDGYFLRYNSYGSYEYGVPAHWSGAVTEDGTFAASNPQAGSVLYVSAVDSDATFHSISQSEYVGIMGENRQSFLLRSFTNDGTSIMAEATYYVGDTEYALIQLRKCNGMFQYAFSFECPMATFNEEAPYFWTAAGLFRFF